MRTPTRILVVDDDPVNVEVLRVRLSAQGYEVVTAIDGEEGLQRARELEPDLVLLDVMMPKLDGISVLKELKADITLRFMPVILLTAKADTRDIVNGLGAGADDYLTKPFEQSALVARVRSLLRIKGLHDTVQLQAARLKEQTEQLSSWNRLLEERVAQQLAQIQRISRLQRFLPPQVAQRIASTDPPESLLENHRREVTALFCELRGFSAFAEASEPEDVMAVLREYHEIVGSNRPRRFASWTDVVMSRSSSVSVRYLTALGRSLGRTWRCVAVSAGASVAGARLVGGEPFWTIWVEKRSGVAGSVRSGPMR